MKITSFLAVLGLATAGLMLPTTADAAAPVAARCGAVLTTDAYLAADLFCPDGNGVRIAGNLTFDLRGHTLRGSWTNGGPSYPAGITVQLGFEPLIRGGTISGWGYGVTHAHADFEWNTATTIDEVHLTGNSIGVNSDGLPFDIFGPPFIIKRSSFDNNVYGIAAFAALAFTVTDSTFRNHRAAISVNTGSVTVRRSGFADNSSGITCDESRCELASSTLLRNTRGVWSSTSGVTATSNTFKNNVTGISSYRVFHGNAITYNKFSDNDTAVNFVVGYGNLSKNSFYGNGVGFTSSTDESGEIVSATLARNVFARNRDAIFTDIAGTSLQGNIVTSNEHWGIYAPLATDLGGNRAFGNGSSPQCVGVSC
ncbi:MAG: NosD domain-containing protein [Nakamurella sp.]